MRKTTLVLAGLAVGLLPTLFTAPAYAQATRTWVSGVGDDANPCSRTAPCKTFAGAISKTATGGEINCLDPGGFGALTVTKAITVSCEIGTAGVLVSGTNAFVINAPTNAFVTLRGLDFEGLGTGLNGVNVLAAAAVHVEKTSIRNFRGSPGVGINVQPNATTTNVLVNDTSITGNATGVQVKPNSTGVARLRTVRVQTDFNNSGIKADGSTSTGGISVHLIETAATANGVSGFEAVGGAATFMNIMRSSASGNSGAGVKQSAGATIQIGESMVFGNGTGISGTVNTYRTNQVNGNGTDGTPMPVVPGGFTAPAGVN